MSIFVNFSIAILELLWLNEWFIQVQRSTKHNKQKVLTSPYSSEISSSLCSSISCLATFALLACGGESERSYDWRARFLSAYSSSSGSSLGGFFGSISLEVLARENFFLKAHQSVTEHHSLMIQPVLYLLASAASLVRKSAISSSHHRLKTFYMCIEIKLVTVMIHSTRSWFLRFFNFRKRSCMGVIISSRRSASVPTDCPSSGRSNLDTSSSER